VLASLNRSDYADATKHSMRSAIKKFYKVENGGHEQPDKTRFFTVGKESSSICREDLFTNEELQRLLRSFSNVRDKAFAMVLYESAARPGELQECSIGDFTSNGKGDFIFLEGKKNTPDRTNQLVRAGQPAGRPDVALQQARMACDGAGLVDEETEESPKLDELEELLEQLCVDGGRKVVVFSEWTKMTSRVVDRAEELGLGVVELTGSVPTSKRGDLLETFNEDPSVQVFVSSDAGGTGLNLQAASVLINLDIPWNPAVLEQRIGRVHRLGQSETVQVVLMIAADSYEERVAGLVGRKQSLFDSVVVGEGGEDAMGLSEDAMEWIDESLDETEDVVGAENSEAEVGDGSDVSTGTPWTESGTKAARRPSPCPYPRIRAREWQPCRPVPPPNVRGPRQTGSSPFPRRSGSPPTPSEPRRDARSKNRGRTEGAGVERENRTPIRQVKTGTGTSAQRDQAPQGSGSTRDGPSTLRRKE